MTSPQPYAFRALHRPDASAQVGQFRSPASDLHAQAATARSYLDLIDRRWFDASGDARHDEFEDLVALFLDAAPDADADVRTLAEVLARACLGDDHLWHDLGLPSRNELSSLLHTQFGPLAARNGDSMRWKKFFYLQLCERAEIRACRAPSCGACTHQTECFGPEDTPLRALGATGAAAGTP